MQLCLIGRAFAFLSVGDRRGRCAVGTTSGVMSLPRPAALSTDLSMSSVSAAEESDSSAKPAVRFGMFPAPRRPSVERGLRYRSDDWLVNFLSIPNSLILRRIRFHLLSNTALCTLVVALARRFPGRVGIPLTGHSLLGSFMSLLLVFRTNSAYARFYEGRTAWAKCMSTCRNLALSVVSHVRPHSPIGAERLLELLTAFPDALSYSCLCGTQPLKKHVEEAINESGGVKWQAGGIVQLEPATMLCSEMHEAVRGAALESPSSSTDLVEAMHLVEVSHQINNLIDSLSTCQKIARTPVPLSYSRHTSRFLTLWCGTLPLALVGSIGAFTVPVVIAVCWCLFGIEEIGHLIEQPFDASSDEEYEEGVESLAPMRKMSEKAQPYDIGMPVCALAKRVRKEVQMIASIGMM